MLSGPFLPRGGSVDVLHDHPLDQHAPSLSADESTRDGFAHQIGEHNGLPESQRDALDFP